MKGGGIRSAHAGAPLLTREEISRLYTKRWVTDEHTALCVMATHLLDIVDAWQRYQRGDLSREEFEGTVAERCE